MRADNRVEREDALLEEADGASVVILAREDVRLSVRLDDVEAYEVAIGERRRGGRFAVDADSNDERRVGHTHHLMDESVVVTRVAEDLGDVDRDRTAIVRGAARLVVRGVGQRGVARLLGCLHPEVEVVP